MSALQICFRMRVFAKARTGKMYAGLFKTVSGVVCSVVEDSNYDSNYEKN